jgi:Arc/MetJ-type ribon-helix-helix transcriptional regulator
VAQKRTHVSFSERLLTDIDELLGKGKRSAFLTEIAEREVRRRKQLRALDAAAGCWKSEDHPELKNGSAAWVKELRSGWDSRLPKDG